MWFEVRRKRRAWQGWKRDSNTPGAIIARHGHTRAGRSGCLVVEPALGLAGARSTLDVARGDPEPVEGSRQAFGLEAADDAMGRARPARDLAAQSSNQYALSAPRAVWRT